MSKISLDKLTSSFSFQAAYNDVLTRIEEEFSDKVLYRNNPEGEPNNMYNDLDMSTHDILNVGVISASGFNINGQDITSTIEEVVLQIEQAVTDSEAAAAEAEGFANEAEAWALAAELSNLEPRLAASDGASLVGYGATTVEGQLDTLLGSGGSDLIGFTQLDVNAVQRSVQDKLRDVVSVNDYTSLQAAIDDLDVKKIDGCGLTYVLTNRVNLRSNITLSNMTLDFSALTELDGSYKTCLKAQGAGVVDSSPLTVNSTGGDYTVTVSVGSKFAAGDYVMLTSEDAYNYPASSVKRGEIKQVQKVIGSVVYFREALYEGYATADTATLKKLSLLENITLENVKIVGANIEGYGNIGFRSQYVRGLKVEGCTFQDIDLYECALFDTIDFDISNNDFDGVRYTGAGLVFYGVVLFNCCQWGTVRANRGQELRHLVTTSSSALFYGQPYFVVVSENIMRNAMAGDDYSSWAYENHGFGRFITWANNIADSCHTGINIEKGDQIVIGNIFRNCRVNGIFFDTDGIELRNIIVSNNRISKSTSDAPSGSFFGIAFASNTGQIRKNILISGNVIDGIGAAGRVDFGIRVYSGNGAAQGCAISGNVITNDNAFESTDYGVYIEQSGWVIRGNTFYNYERGVSVVSGISGVIIQGNDFAVATISGTFSVLALQGSQCIVTGNVFKNVYKSITNSGSGNIVQYNTEIGVSVATSPL